MSGLVAVVHTDGAPVASELIERLTSALVLRGPDARATRCLGEAALGHTLLSRSSRDAQDCQPLTIDGRTWIVAHARVDDRTALARRLEISPFSTDAELLLRAFMRWDAQCVDHLLGDFTFVIWDARSRRLVCARDHLGIRPLFYAQAGPWLLVSNDLDCLRRMPDVSDELDDLAVADFLLFGHKAEPSATTFRDIRRVPAGHQLVWTPESRLVVRRYWEFPVEEPSYCPDEEYAAQLRELLATSVADRARSEKIAIFLSGGLDSTAVAAAAKALPTASHDGVRGFTFVYRSLLHDDEDEAVAAAVRHLAIAWGQYVVDGERGWTDAGTTATPEPFLPSIEDEARRRCYTEAAAYSRIALNGEGADNALHYEWRAYLAYLRRTRRWSRIARDGFAFLGHCRRPPLLHWLLHGGRDTLSQPHVVMPPWIAAELIDRFDLHQRWREVMRAPVSDHPVRPVAYFSFHMPMWQWFFDASDPAYTGAPVEVAYPFLDLRVLRFLMRVPVVPWCRDKYLLRYAFRDALPPALRTRRKTPLQAHPYHEKVKRDGLPGVVFSPRLDAYASLKRFDAAPASPDATEAALRLSALSRWLARLESASAAAALR